MANTGDAHGLFWNDDNGDREYDANSMEYWLKKFFTSGVFNGDLQVRATSGMTLEVEPGYTNANGKVKFWNAPFNVTLDAANSTYPRIDTVVITRDNVNRTIFVEKITGQYSAETPQPTAPVRNAELYQLVLAQIYVAAGATGITQANITDTRPDLDLCGYITGTVEELDFSAFTDQFERYFAEFKATHMANFSEWEIAQKAAYNSWFDLVKQQQIQDKAAWDAWYADLQEELHELPPESAEYLQIEIDEIKESGLSGSILKITTINSELEGKTVTVTGNYHNEERTGVFDSNLECEIIGIKSVGNVNISSTDGIRTAEATLNIPYYGNYNVPIAFWAATINLQGDENLYGALVTIKNSNDETVGTVVLSAVDGTATFTATAPDTYTFSVTYQGEEITQTLVVDEETTYEVSLSAGFNYKTWCTEGGVDATQYSSLADVFADELAVHRLMTKHASSDYLIEAVSDDVDVIDDFCANDTAMKWIGLRDYVCDGLTAINGVVAKFLASQYWERYLKDHVPTMTSNTAPYGVASASSVYANNHIAYMAFDGNLSTSWAPLNSDNSPSVGYDFTVPTDVKRFGVYSEVNSIQTFTLQGSNDGVTWVDVSSAHQGTKNNEWEYFDRDLLVGTYFMKYRLREVQNGGNTNLTEVQFYGRSLNVSVPIMTSNNAPYGVVSASSYANTHEPFKAFNSDIGTSWLPTLQATNNSIEYVFDTKLVVKALSIAFGVYGDVAHTFEISVSDGGDDYTQIGTITSHSTNETKRAFATITNHDLICDRVKIFCADKIYSGGNCALADISIFGLDYSEREFEPNSNKKWLYDHGLELEPISVIANGTSEATKNADSVYLKLAGANNQYVRMSTTNKIDLTNYSLIRIILGDKLGGAVTCSLSGSTNTLTNSDISSMVAEADISYSKPTHNSLNVNNVDDEVYLNVFKRNTSTTNSTEITVSELWLEQ